MPYAYEIALMLFGGALACIGWWFIARQYDRAIGNAFSANARLRNNNDWLETQLEMREQEAADLTAGLQVEVDRLNGTIADLEAFKAKRNMSRKQRAELAAPAPKAKPYVASANSLQAVAL